MPQKLVAYRQGLRTEIKRRAYSAVNKMVKSHSSLIKASPYRTRTPEMLSSITPRTLNKMQMMSRMSKSSPANVSASKMTS